MACSKKLLLCSRTLLRSLQSRSLATSVVKRSESDNQEISSVIVEKVEEFKVYSIALNRPSKRNCVNKETSEKLYEAFNEFENDENYNVAILHGIGGNFCAGYDLDELAKVDRDNIANEIVSSFAKSQSSFKSLSI